MQKEDAAAEKRRIQQHRKGDPQQNTVNEKELDHRKRQHNERKVDHKVQEWKVPGIIYHREAQALNEVWLHRNVPGIGDLGK